MELLEMFLRIIYQFNLNNFKTTHSVKFQLDLNSVKIPLMIEGIIMFIYEAGLDRINRFI